MNARTWIAATLAVCTSACSSDHEHEAGTQAEQADEARSSSRVDIPPTIQRNLGITFTEVERRRVASTIRVPGAFELEPLARHEYRMVLPGRVELLVDQYDVIETGQPLFRFESPAWAELVHEIMEAEQSAKTAVVEIEVAEASREEAKSKLALVQGRIDALAQADFKRADLEAEAGGLRASMPRLEGQLRLAEAKLSNAHSTREHALHRASTASGIDARELGKSVVEDSAEVPVYRTIEWIEVRAARPGIVEVLAITDGAFVEPPTNVLSTVDPQRVRFRALALQADLPELAVATDAKIVPPPNPGIPIADAVAANVTLGLEAHPQERTLTLIASPEQLAPWIRPGVSAFLEVVVDTTEAPTLAIPRSAIVQDELEHIFFRRDPKDPNTAIRVVADMGVSDGRWVAIQSGAMVGDEVVVAGSYELKLATQQSGASQKGGHVHADGTFHEEED